MRNVNPIRWVWPLFAVVMIGCMPAGLYSRGERPIAVTGPDGIILRDAAGAPIVGILKWDSRNVYPANMKDLSGARAGETGASTGTTTNFQMPESKTLSLMLALACALGAAFCLWRGLTAFALPLAGAGAFIAAVPYVMPALAAVAPYIAIGGAAVWVGLLIWNRVTASKAAAANEAERDDVSLATFGKCVAEGNLAGAVQVMRDMYPEANAAVIFKKAQGVKPKKKGEIE